MRMPPPPDSERRQVVARFDQNGDGRLDAEERQAARRFLAEQPRRGPPPPPGSGAGGPPPPFGILGRTPPQAGPKIAFGEVTPILDAPLYDSATLRTLFLRFDAADWEKELADFWHTDVDVPAVLTVDGRSYADVGVHFRGTSSFMMVPAGYKRSLNLALDYRHQEQRLLGYPALHLLNSSTDPTFLRTVLFLTIARSYLPAPRANHVRLVINGESWGIYVNAQPFNRAFVTEWFGTDKGARWKVPGSPGGRGGLDYLGDDVDRYRQLYELKSKENPRAWADLMGLCKTLAGTPPERLESALESRLDIDGALRFLALDVALINGDGYWTRASDYDLYQDPRGRFHLVPYDANETFEAPGGPPIPGLPSAHGVELDPLVGADDASKPLRSKLLAVPALRARYLRYVRDIARTWLDWNRLGPLVEEYASRLRPHVKSDTRKLESAEAFERGLDEGTVRQGPCGPEQQWGLKRFAARRRAFLLGHPAISQLSE